LNKQKAAETARKTLSADFSYGEQANFNMMIGDVFSSFL